MKAKKILITYLNNGNLQSQVAKEYLFQKVLGQLLTEGKIAKNTIALPQLKEIKFEDGSEIRVIPLSHNMRGFRCTHMYIDQNILSTPNGSEISLVLQQAVVRGEYLNFDTSEKDRAFVFSLEDGTLNLKNI
jgi:hypothetical protein